MLKRYLLIIILCCTGVATATAQNTASAIADRKTCSCGFSSINQVGIVQGQRDNQFLAQTINGFRYKTWFAGVGAGYDAYGVQTIPLFLDIRKNLLKRAATPFVYADGGIQFMAEKGKKADERTGKDYETGAYYDIGLGYQVRLSKNNALLLSAGYSVKTVQWDTFTDIVCVTTPCNNFIGSYKYRYNRLSFKLGYRFR